MMANLAPEMINLTTICFAEPQEIVVDSGFLKSI